MQMAGQVDDRAPGGRAKFIEQADRQRSGLIVERWDFLRNSEKWWLTLVLLLFGILLELSATATAPIIYTLF
jgi:hypothetical protein